MDEKITIERSYAASPEEVWRRWTTAEGIESWWSPDGFAVEVEELDLRPGGELRYTMTATGDAQIEFMHSVGMPLATTSRKTFTDVDPPRRLAYDSLVDFVPGVPAYWHPTLVEIEPEGDGVRVVMTIDRLHDDEWTQRLVMGRTNELDNLGKVVGG